MSVCCFVAAPIRARLPGVFPGSLNKFNEVNICELRRDLQETLVFGSFTELEAAKLACLMNEQGTVLDWRGDCNGAWAANSCMVGPDEDDDAYQWMIQVDAFGQFLLKGTDLELLGNSAKIPEFDKLSEAQLHCQRMETKIRASSSGVLNPGGLVLAHDSLPPSEQVTLPGKGDFYCGEVYKAVMKCGLEYVTTDVTPLGLTMIRPIRKRNGYPRPTRFEDWQHRRLQLMRVVAFVDFFRYAEKWSKPFEIVEQVGRDAVYAKIVDVAKWHDSRSRYSTAKLLKILAEMYLEADQENALEIERVLSKFADRRTCAAEFPE